MVKKTTQEELGELSRPRHIDNNASRPNGRQVSRNVKGNRVLLSADMRRRHDSLTMLVKKAFKFDSQAIFVSFPAHASINGFARRGSRIRFRVMRDSAAEQCGEVSNSVDLIG